jgi:hypothetical protein
MRRKLPDRRLSITSKVPVTLDMKTWKILITVGFEVQIHLGKKHNVPLEVFCADFKAGTAIHTIVMDACILMSRLLQHGDTPEDIVKSLCQPPSLVGIIAQAVKDMMPCE